MASVRSRPNAYTSQRVVPPKPAQRTREATTAGRTSEGTIRAQAIFRLSCVLKRVENIFPAGNAVAGMEYVSCGGKADWARSSAVRASEMPASAARRLIRRRVDG